MFLNIAFDLKCVVLSENESRIKEVRNLCKQLNFGRECTLDFTLCGKLNGDCSVYDHRISIESLRDIFYSDNDYIKIMVETGILGTLVYAGFVLSMFWSQDKNIAQLVLLFIFFFMGMFYNITELQVLCMIFYILFDFQERKIENE